MFAIIYLQTYSLLQTLAICINFATYGRVEKYRKIARL